MVVLNTENGDQHRFRCRPPAAECSANLEARCGRGSVGRAQPCQHKRLLRNHSLVSRRTALASAFAQLASGPSPMSFGTHGSHEIVGPASMNPASKRSSPHKTETNGLVIYPFSRRDALRYPRYNLAATVRTSGSSSGSERMIFSTFKRPTSSGTV